MESKLRPNNKFNKEHKGSSESDERVQSEQNRETEQWEKSEQNEKSEEGEENVENEENHRYSEDIEEVEDSQYYHEHKTKANENNNEDMKRYKGTKETKIPKEKKTSKHEKDLKFNKSKTNQSENSDERYLSNFDTVDNNEMDDNQNMRNDDMANDRANTSIEYSVSQIVEMIKSKNYELLLQKSLEIPRSQRKEIYSSMMTEKTSLDKLLKNEKNEIIVFAIHGLLSSEAQYDAFMIHYSLEKLKNINYVMKIFALKTKSKMEDIAVIFYSTYKTSLISALKPFIPDKDFISQLFTIDRYQLDEKDEIIEKTATEIYQNIFKMPAKTILNIFISYSPLSFQKLCSYFYLKYSYPITYFLKSRKIELVLNEILIIFHDILLSPLANQLRNLTKFSIVRDSIVFFTYSLLSLNEEILEILNAMYRDQYSLKLTDITKIYPAPLNNIMREYINRCIF